jgi:hypothetical protein
MLLIFFTPLHICIFLWFSLRNHLKVLNVDSICLNIGLATVDIACVLCSHLLCCYLILMNMESIQHKKDDFIVLSSFAILLKEKFGNMIETP